MRQPAQLVFNRAGAGAVQKRIDGSFEAHAAAEYSGSLSQPCCAAAGPHAFSGLCNFLFTLLCHCQIYRASAIELEMSSGFLARYLVASGWHEQLKRGS